MRSAKQGGFSEQSVGCSPTLQMRRLSLREAQQASRFHGLAAVQEQKLLERMGGGTPGASTPRVLISGEVPAPGLLGSLESEPLPSIALRVPHPPWWEGDLVRVGSEVMWGTQNSPPGNLKFDLISYLSSKKSHQAEESAGNWSFYNCQVRLSLFLPSEGK